MEELKRVSYKVAKALKEAGYPQGNLSVWYDRHGVIFTIRPKEGTEYYVAPEYLKVWLWLWREKRIFIEILQNVFGVEMYIWKDYYDNIYKEDCKDPEEAIIAAIEYIVNNKLLK